MIFKSFHLLLVCAVAALFAGCGGEGPAAGTSGATAPDPTTNRQADRAIADAALIRLDDFRAGWKARPAPTPTRSGDCRSERDTSAVEARSPEFVFPAEVKVVELVAVYPSEADAERTLARQVSDAQVACNADALQRAVRRQIPSDATVGEVTAARIEVQSAGEQIAAYRFTIPLSRGDASADYHNERVVVRVGRGLLGLGFSTADAGPQRRIREAVTRLATQRLAAALGGPES